MRRVRKCFDLCALSRSQCLHTAVAESNIESVHRLLLASIPVDQQDDVNNTPLHIAAWRGDAEIAQILIKQGAQVNEKRMDGRTPLDLVEMRLRHDCDTPPEGLPMDTFFGNHHDVAQLLREFSQSREVQAEAQNQIYVPQFAHSELAQNEHERVKQIEADSNCVLNALSVSSLSTCASMRDFDS